MVERWVQFNMYSKSHVTITDCRRGVKIKHRSDNHCSDATLLHIHSAMTDITEITQYIVAGWRNVDCGMVFVTSRLLYEILVEVYADTNLQYTKKLAVPVKLWRKPRQSCLKPGR